MRSRSHAPFTNADRRRGPTWQSPFGAPARVAELSGPNHDIGVEIALRDAAALVTVMVNGRAVILSAARTSSTTLPGLSASWTVGPAEILSATLRSQAGHLGVVLLGAPLALPTWLVTALVLPLLHPLDGG